MFKPGQVWQFIYQTK